MQTYETVLTEMIGEHLLKVTLNRPEVGNAKNTQMGLDLLDLWTRLIDDPRELHCGILIGAGNRISCAGGDLKQRKGMTPNRVAIPARDFRPFPRRAAGVAGAGHRHGQRPCLCRRAGDGAGL
jgi:enoyl-CoA hydratase/carnithine racemase